MARYAVAVTGGVASGKSAVTQRFEQRGIVCIDADIAAREVVTVGSEALAEVVATFGAGILADDGSLDRRAMRERVFADADARQRLESIVHPRVRALLRAQADAAPGHYVVVAIPLLTEGGGRDGYPWIDRILLVDVPVEVQLQRLQARDGVDAALAQRMVDAQATRVQRLAIADDILRNDGLLDALDPHVAALDALYRALASASGERVSAP